MCVIEEGGRGGGRREEEKKECDLKECYEQHKKGEEGISRGKRLDNELVHVACQREDAYTNGQYCTRKENDGELLLSFRF